MCSPSRVGRCGQEPVRACPPLCVVSVGRTRQLSRLQEPGPSSHRAAGHRVCAVLRDGRFLSFLENWGMIHRTASLILPKCATRRRLGYRPRRAAAALCDSRTLDTSRGNATPVSRPAPLCPRQGPSGRQCTWEHSGRASLHTAGHRDRPASAPCAWPHHLAVSPGSGPGPSLRVVLRSFLWQNNFPPCGHTPFRCIPRRLTDVSAPGPSGACLSLWLLEHAHVRMFVWLHASAASGAHPGWPPGSRVDPTLYLSRACQTPSRASAGRPASAPHCGSSRGRAAWKDEASRVEAGATATWRYLTPHRTVQFYVMHILPQLGLLSPCEWREGLKSRGVTESPSRTAAPLARAGGCSPAGPSCSGLPGLEARRGAGHPSAYVAILIAARPLPMVLPLAFPQ